LDKFMVFYSL